MDELIRSNVNGWPPGLPMWMGVVLGVSWTLLGLSAITLAVYSTLAVSIFKHGGKVSVREFGIPDLFFGSVFVLWFGTSIALGLGHDKPHELTQTNLLRGGYFFAGIVIAISWFLHARGIKPWRQFGLGQVNPLKAGVVAFALLILALPLIAWVSEITSRVLGPEAKRQELVLFFQKAHAHSDRMTVFLIIALGVVLAPIAEELMFRGYIYGVLKRYCGMIVAVIVSAGMFAAIHQNLASLPGLFILAVCFAIAYETTGSLLVNISMHALFNLTMFLQMLYLQQPPVQ